ncbi:MAG: hypothetical protein IKB13_05805, partial [Clostridia bacterium]|nr:hypothetical protein [Clostridia bacterium]
PHSVGEMSAELTKGDGTVSLYEKQSTGLFVYSPALLCGKGISPVATGDERLRLSTPQTFEKV